VFQFGRRAVLTLRLNDTRQHHASHCTVKCRTPLRRLAYSCMWNRRTTSCARLADSLALIAVEANGVLRINLLLERAKRYGYCMPDLPTFEELCDTADDQLFNKTVSNSVHVLHTALPPPSTASQHYNLRRRTHTLSLPEHFTYLSDCNSITRMLHKHSY